MTILNELATTVARTARRATAEAAPRAGAGAGQAVVKRDAAVISEQARKLAEARTNALLLRDERLADWRGVVPEGFTGAAWTERLGRADAATLHAADQYRGIALELPPGPGFGGRALLETFDKAGERHVYLSTQLSTAAGRPPQATIYAFAAHPEVATALAAALPRARAKAAAKGATPVVAEIDRLSALLAAMPWR